jgi:hypothetical protein
MFIAGVINIGFGIGIVVLGTVIKNFNTVALDNASSINV